MHLTLSAYQQALNDIAVEYNLEYQHFNSQVKLDYNKANTKISDKGPIEFDNNFILKKASDGYGGDFAYVYIGGNKVVGNTLFGSFKGRGSNRRNTFFDGVYNGYYKVEFYGSKGKLQTIGQLLFKDKSSYQRFVNHYQNIYDHFKRSILKQKNINN